MIREVIGTAADILYCRTWKPRRGPRRYGGRRSSWRRIRPGVDARRTRTHPPGAAVAVLHGGGGFYSVTGLAGRSADCQPWCVRRTDGGACAALTLAAVKRLFFEHRQLATGAFNQFTPNRMPAGRVCGLFGFGGLASPRRGSCGPWGCRFTPSTGGATPPRPTDWIGTPEQLDVLLRAADVVVIAAPLTRATLGRIGAQGWPS